MANSINEAINEAINELKQKEFVIDAEVDGTFSEDKPCNYIRRRINVFHKEETTGGYTFSSKEIYINKKDFSWKWAYGGLQLESRYKFRNYIKNRLSNIKKNQNFDAIRIINVDEEAEIAELEAIQSISNDTVEKINLLVFKDDSGNLNIKKINKAETK